MCVVLCVERRHHTGKWRELTEISARSCSAKDLWVAAVETWNIELKTVGENRGSDCMMDNAVKCTDISYVTAVM